MNEKLRGTIFHDFIKQSLVFHKICSPLRSRVTYYAINGYTMYENELQRDATGLYV